MSGMNIIDGDNQQIAVQKNRFLIAIGSLILKLKWNLATAS